ncbi:MAG: uroporphyrinogen decarboxylase family protein [Candidatus Omnitrophota bacterium]
MLDIKLNTRIKQAFEFKPTALPIICDYITNQKIIAHFSKGETDYIKKLALASREMGIDIYPGLFLTEGRKYREKPRLLKRIDNYHFPSLTNAQIKEKIACFVKNKHVFAPEVELTYFSDGCLSAVYNYLGFELFCEILKTRISVIERIVSETAGNCMSIAAEFTKYFTEGIYFIGDDIAGSRGLLFSPETLRRLWLPNLKKIAAILKRKNIKIILHADGDIFDILSELIEIGIDGVHPVELSGKMQTDKIRKSYGKNLLLLGGLDLYSKNKKQIITQAMKNLKAAKKMGYFPGSTSGIGEGLNVDFVFDIYRKIKRL